MSAGLNHDYTDVKDYQDKKIMKTLIEMTQQY